MLKIKIRNASIQMLNAASLSCTDIKSMDRQHVNTLSQSVYWMEQTTCFEKKLNKKLLIGLDSNFEQICILKTDRTAASGPFMRLQGARLVEKYNRTVTKPLHYIPMSCGFLSHWIPTIFGGLQCDCIFA